MDPKLVTFPVSHWTLMDVLVEDGVGPETGWSLAMGEWTDDSGDRARVLGCRWNGDQGTIGTPSLRGEPTWFILPQPLTEIILASEVIPAAKQQLANTFMNSPA